MDQTSPTGPRASRALIHVGPHKTGTTTVQSAFHLNREALADHRIHYVGPRLQPTQAVKATTGATPEGAARQAGLEDWARLVSEARAADADQIVLSSEFLCEADDDVARQVIEDFGVAEPRVVVTLRPLAKIVPSQWQQFVQSGTTKRIGPWVESVFEHTSDGTVKLFWKRHRHDALVERWVRVVGPENVTVVVCDSSDPDQLPREFARLLGLPPGVLVPGQAVANRSFTRQEAEVARRFNEQLKTLNEQRASRGGKQIKLTFDEILGAWRHVKRRKPRRDEQPITLPPSVSGLVADLAQEMVDNIVATRAQVIGDLSLLTETPPTDGEDPAEVHSIPVGLAARVAVGLLSNVIREDADRPS